MGMGVLIVGFKCTKCNYPDEDNTLRLQEIIDLNCPNCGEESYGNWILLKMDNWER